MVNYEGLPQSLMERAEQRMPGSRLQILDLDLPGSGVTSEIETGEHTETEDEILAETYAMVLERISQRERFLVPQQYGDMRSRVGFRQTALIVDQNRIDTRTGKELLAASCSKVPLWGEINHEQLLQLGLSFRNHQINRVYEKQGEILTSSEGKISIESALALARREFPIPNFPSEGEEELKSLKYFEKIFEVATGHTQADYRGLGLMTLLLDRFINGTSKEGEIVFGIFDEENTDIERAFRRVGNSAETRIDIISPEEQEAEMPFASLFLNMMPYEGQGLGVRNPSGELPQFLQKMVSEDFRNSYSFNRRRNIAAKKEMLIEFNNALAGDFGSVDNLLVVLRELRKLAYAMSRNAKPIAYKGNGQNGNGHNGNGGTGSNITNNVFRSSENARAINNNAGGVSPSFISRQSGNWAGSSFLRP
jgi:hypothetical protein